MNSGPLSERMCSGAPRRINRSDRASMTSVDLSFLSIRITRHSRVTSSTMFSIRYFLASCVRSSTLSPQTEAGSIVEQKPSPLQLFLWDLQPLAPPDALDPLVVDDPAGGRSQKFRDLPVAVAAILAGEFDDVGGQAFIIISPRRRPSLR
jgi:hypothetical protein